MIYQLTSAKQVIARIDNNFDIDYSDWISRAPLWIADALDRLLFISSYEDTYIDLDVVDHIAQLPDNVPSDIKRILGVEYDGYLIKRLNVVNPIKQPTVECEYLSTESYSIKNGYLVLSFEEGTVRLYYQVAAIEWEQELQVYLPKIPNNSIIQDAIGWYLMYCMLRRGHKHPIYSLENKNPITNPYLMWEVESKKAMNQASGFDPEDRAEMSRLLRTFLIDTDRPINGDFRNDNNINLSESITGQTGISE
jgi:hypothetical protein